MRNLKLTVLLFLFAFLQLGNAFAQADYVITVNRDTIACKIKKDFLSGHYRYRVNKDSGYITIKSDKIKEYFIAKDTVTFIVKKLPEANHEEWVRWLERGRINLYMQTITYNRQNGPDEADFFYVSKINDSLHQVKTSELISSHNIGSHKDRVKTFLNIVADDPYIVSEIKKAKLESNYDIISIWHYIKIYNNRYLVNH